MKEKILFVSLGCDKNLVDSERMLALLDQEGYSFTGDETEADIIIVNSCCFIGEAKEESIETILRMAQMKKEGKCRLLLVTGCLAERYRDEILTEMPEVDGILGTTSYEEIGTLIRDSYKKQGAKPLDRPEIFHDLSELPEERTPDRILSTGGYYAYLKIAEGCDKRCTYCVIPSVRGSYRSVPMPELLKEAEKLAEGGVRELILVAQETTLYGVDLYGKKMLPALLRELAEISGISWIRLLYCYPEEITDELIKVMKEEPKICHYLDIPVQHCSDKILKKMGRHTTKSDLTAIIDRLREEIPDIALRTTLMTGFPGETEEDQEELLAFVDETAFTRLGVFCYSAEEGTPAYLMPDQVPEEVSEKRRDEIMQLQQEISSGFGEDLIGKEFTVMVEGKLEDEDVYAARTYMDAPDVDGTFFLQTEQELMSGDFVRAVVTDAMEYDLIGVPVE